MSARLEKSFHGHRRCIGYDRPNFIAMGGKLRSHLTDGFTNTRKLRGLVEANYQVACRAIIIYRLKRIPG